MTASEFRSLALELPEAVESSHMDHPDFRIGKRIFATLGPGEIWGVVKLTPEQQLLFVNSEPEVFQPVTGSWGHRGATKVILESATEPSVRQALLAAWRNTAPKRLVRQMEAQQE
jgi:hypothetical protein